MLVGVPGTFLKFSQIRPQKKQDASHQRHKKTRNEYTRAIKDFAAMSLRHLGSRTSCRSRSAPQQQQICGRHLAHQVGQRGRRERDASFCQGQCDQLNSQRDGELNEHQVADSSISRQLDPSEFKPPIVTFEIALKACILTF